MTHKLRLPAGQTESSSWVAMPPIHSTYPETKLENWKLKIYGLVENKTTLTWDEFQKLGLQDYQIDFHCVTRWSKLNQNFTGLSFAKILALAKPLPNAKYVIFEGDDGYTTNLNLDEIKSHGDVFIATAMDKKEIPIRFGGPVRAVIPQLYGWKSCKFLTAIRFIDKDEPGFWETRGYHNHGDPWFEERYSF